MLKENIKNVFFVLCVYNKYLNDHIPKTLTYYPMVLCKTATFDSVRLIKCNWVESCSFALQHGVVFKIYGNLI